MFIDAHSHLDKYNDADLIGVLDAISRDSILTLAVSVDVPSFGRTEEIASRSDHVIPGFGVHPSEAPRYADRLAALEKTVARSPMLGELGLDHRFVVDASQYEAQRRVFSWFLAEARDQNKLVNVHCAGAEEETAHLLRQHDVDRVIIHWYSGPLDVLSVMIGAGYMFTVGVEVMHSDHIRDVAAAVPTDQILTETDNPGGLEWLTGETGYPAVLSRVLDELARVRGTDPTELNSAVLANLRRIMSGDPHLAPWARAISG